MPTTFKVIYLGDPGIEIDQTEGNAVAENAAALIGQTFGGDTQPLFSNIGTLSPEVTSGGWYSTDNNAANDQFSVDGRTYTIDGLTVYGGTVEYADGATSVADLKIIQATTGEFFLVPFVAGEEAQQAVLEAGPIQSISLTSVVAGDGVMSVDRLESDYVGSVDGSIGGDNMSTTYVDGQLDEIDGSDGDADAILGHSGDDTINGGAATDLIGGGADDDSIFGGAGNDILVGDFLDGSERGTLNFRNADNLEDDNSTESLNIRAVELVWLPNGDLIMITSERGSSTDNGIRSYEIDTTPGSPTYGQIIGTNGLIQADVGGTEGYDDIEDMEAVTTSGGDTYLYTADPNLNTIGVTQINADGSLTRLTSSNVTNSVDLDEVQELTHVTVGGQDFLIALTGGNSDNIQTFQINADGSLTQTDIVGEASGVDENFLSNTDDTDASMLESFTNSAGQTFIVNSGTSGIDDGIALWTMSGSGVLTLQDARGDNDAGADSNDERGNALGRDLINPPETALDDVNAATFAEIDGQTYLITGDGDSDDNVSIWRIDTGGIEDFQFTLVGQVNVAANDITSMETLLSDDGVHIVIGSTTGGLQIMDVVVNTNGTVDVVPNTIFNPSGAQLGSSENIAIVDDILVSASDNDNGVAIIRTGLNVGSTGDDTIDGGAGDDTISGDQGADSLLGGAGDDSVVGGVGADTLDGGTGADRLEGGDDADLFELGDSFGSDTIVGGEGVSTGADSDVIDAGGRTSGIGLEYITVESGAITDGVDTITFSEIEEVLLTEHADVVSAALLTLGVEVDGLGGDDILIGGSGGDTLSGGHGDDFIDGGDGDDILFTGEGQDTLFGGAGNDTLSNSDGDDSLDGGAGDDSITATGGEDTLRGGTGDDTMDGGDDADTFIIEDNFGNDVIVGGEGTTDPGDRDFDVIDLSMMSGPVTVTYTGDEAGTITNGSDTITFSQIESLILTDQADVLDADLDNVGIVVDGGAGNDSIEGGGCADAIEGGLGNDSIRGRDGDDSISGGDGNDVFIYAPNDGRDTITDFNFDNTGTLDDGDSTNNNFIDLSGVYDHISELYADQADDGELNQSNTTDTRGNAVDYSNNASFTGTQGITFQGASADSSSFTAENTGVTCFTAGTAITTPRGDVLIEDLRVGDLVDTADNGPQPIRWIGVRSLNAAALSADEKLRPVLVKQGALGNRRPLLVSQQHGLIMGDHHLVRAKHLVNEMLGLRIAHGKRQVTYVHLMFDAHQIIFAEGCMAESFYPGPTGLQMMHPATCAEVFAIFPELRGAMRDRGLTVRRYGHTARAFLPKREIAQGVVV